MNRRRRYGQHFLVSGQVAGRIARMCGATGSDTVLEVGTGRGILTRALCGCARQVVSIEADARLYGEAASKQWPRHLRLLQGDGFSTDIKFDVFASNLPYSQSRRALHWMACSDFRCGAVMVQEEFGQKIMARGRDRRAVSVIWQEAFEVTGSMQVPPHCFEPVPAVGSVVLSFAKKCTMKQSLIKSIHALFSSRRKVVHGRYRIDELSSDQVVEIARTL